MPEPTKVAPGADLLRGQLFENHSPVAQRIEFRETLPRGGRDSSQLHMVSEGERRSATSKGQVLTEKWRAKGKFWAAR